MTNWMCPSNRLIEVRHTLLNNSFKWNDLITNRNSKRFTQRPTISILFYSYINYPLTHLWFIYCQLITIVWKLNRFEQLDTWSWLGLFISNKIDCGISFFYDWYNCKTFDQTDTKHVMGFSSKKVNIRKWDPKSFTKWYL